MLLRVKRARIAWAHPLREDRKAYVEQNTLCNDMDAASMYVRTTNLAIVCACHGQELRVESVLSGFQFIWQSPETLTQFVDAANNLSPESKDTKPPSWISQPRGSITEVTFVNDLLKYLAELGGGFHEDTKLIMPNTSTQAYNICRRLGHIEMDPFMQACVAELPDDAHFASVMRLFEDPGINACPVYFVAPPPPFRQLFF